MLNRRTFGKPRLCGVETLQFNMGHMQDAVGFALSRRRVGFDVERWVPFPEMEAVATIAFAQERRAVLSASSETTKLALFYRCWTLGGAYIEAAGLGAFQNLHGFAFTADELRLMRAESKRRPPER